MITEFRNRILNAKDHQEEKLEKHQNLLY